jgi:hypothetical protein
MISRIGFAPAKADLPLPEAQRHWAGHHAEVSIGLPGLQRYWQNHAVLHDGAPLLPWTGFDCCSEFDFDDGFTMDRAFTSDHYLAEIRPDEAVLVDKTKGGMLLADRHIVTEIDPDASFRLMSFYRTAPLRRSVDLADRLTVAEKAADSSGRELYIAVDGAAAGQRQPMFDAIEMDWFQDSAAALAFMQSAAWRRRRRDFAELVRGSEHLIAHVRRFL